MLCSGISAVIKMKKEIMVKLKTASVELSPSLEASMCSSSPEFKGILWNMKVYCSVQYMSHCFLTSDEYSSHFSIYVEVFKVISFHQFFPINPIRISVAFSACDSPPPRPKLP